MLEPVQWSPDTEGRQTMYSEHNAIKNAKRMSNSWVSNKFYRKKRNAKIYQKIKLTKTHTKPFKNKYLLLKHKTTDSLLQTDIWNTYLEIRDIRLFSKFENNSHQDRICSFFVSRSSNILQNTKPCPITVSSTFLNAILLTTKDKENFLPTSI